MKKTYVHADRAYSIGQVDERVFSSFIEHMGRAVYGGIYEPGHATADANGFRQDVAALTRPLHVPLIRYPGGNFLSGLDWRDTIGPKQERPQRLDMAWRTRETNQFGMDEFVDWCAQVGSQMMGAVNLGTAGIKEAAELVEYCNHPAGTALSDLRAANGHPKPHHVRVWCLGNEMSGPWQIGHMSAEDYAKKARETAKAMKWIDPTIELVACGSAGSELPSYPAWDRTVLEQTYEHVEYLSLHKYYRVGVVPDRDLASCFFDLDRFFHQVEATCDYVQALKRSPKKMMLSFDEWNIAGIHYAKAAKNWEPAPALGEMSYTLRDAVAFAGMGMTILNHADRVKIACQAQLVNVLGPILTQTGGPAIRQTIYFPYLLLSRYGRGEAIRTAVKAPTRETCFGNAPQVYASVIWHEAEQQLCVFLINADDTETAQAEMDWAGFGNLTLSEHLALCGDPSARNTFEDPERVGIQTLPVSMDETIELLPLSFHTLIYRCGGQPSATKGEVPHA